VVHGSIWFEFLLQGSTDTLGAIVVNVLDLVFSERPQAHVQDEAGMLSKAHILIVLLALSCGLCPVTLHTAQDMLTLFVQAKCCMVLPCWPVALGKFRAFGHEISIQ
jgi:hypothetical protein